MFIFNHVPHDKLSDLPESVIASSPKATDELQHLSFNYMQPQFKSFQWRKNPWNIFVNCSLDILTFVYYFCSILAFRSCFVCWNAEHEQICYLSLRDYLQERLYYYINLLTSLTGGKTCISLDLPWLFLNFWVFYFLFELLIP